jgi:hypothetical protein
MSALLQRPLCSLNTSTAFRTTRILQISTKTLVMAFYRKQPIRYKIVTATLHNKRTPARSGAANVHVGQRTTTAGLHDFIMRRTMGAMWGIEKLKSLVWQWCESYTDVKHGMWGKIIKRGYKKLRLYFFVQRVDIHVEIKNAKHRSPKF